MHENRFDFKKHGSYYVHSASLIVWIMVWVLSDISIPHLIFGGIATLGIIERVAEENIVGDDA